MKPVDVIPNLYIDFGLESTYKDSKLGRYHVRISKYKNNFAKGHTPNSFEKLFFIKKVKYCFLDMCNRRPWWRRSYWNIVQKRIVKDKSNRV